MRQSTKISCVAHTVNYKHMSTLLIVTKFITILAIWLCTYTGIYFHEPEITPSGRGVYRFDKNSTQVETFPPEVEVRAVIEGQILAKLSHARKLGYEISSSSRVLATGGAAANKKILQVSRATNCSVSVVVVGGVFTWKCTLKAEPTVVHSGPQWSTVHKAKGVSKE